MKAVRKKHIGLIMVGAATVLGITLVGFFGVEPSKRSGFLTGWMVFILIALSTFVIMWIRRRIKSTGPSRFDKSRKTEEAKPTTIDHWDSLVRSVEASRWSRTYLYQRMFSRILATQPDNSAKVGAHRRRMGLADIESVLDLIEETEDKEK